MVQTELRLVLGPVDSRLSHPAHLYSHVFQDTITNTQIGTISVKKLDGSSITDIRLSVDEDFIVKCRISNSLT